MGVLFATWYAACLLGWGLSTLQSVIGTMVVLPVLLVIFVLYGPFFLPANLLINLRLELPEAYHLVFLVGYSLSVVLLHV